MRFDPELLIWLAGTAVLLGPVMVLLVRRRHSWPYLVCFFVLAVYLSIVARETLVYHSLPAFEGRSADFDAYANVVPGRAGPGTWSSFDLEQVIINILLGVPLGFGLNFVRLVRARTLPWVALGFGFTIEAVQLVSSLIVGHPRHIADVNDLLLNAAGVAAGYVLFRVFARAYSAASRRRHALGGTLFTYVRSATLRDGGAGPR